jgi:hypothetical protein
MNVSPRKRLARRIFKGFAILVMLGVFGIAALLVSVWLEQRTPVTLPAPTGAFAVGRALYDWADDQTLALCITKTPSSGFPSNVTLLLPGRLLNAASSSLPHVADFNGIRHRWDLRDSGTRRSKICPGCSIPSFEAGFGTTGGIIARRYIRRCANWIGI